MWIILGFIAILMTLINLGMYAAGKDYKIAMAMGLSFTSLTLCAENSLIANWVNIEDWTALLDVVPTMKKSLWILTVISILLNIAPIILDVKQKHKFAK